MKVNQYEAMFLFDPTFATPFENCEAEIRRLMERAEAEILFCRLWDERRLAYKIKTAKRGSYVLTFFKAPTGKIGGLERDAQLSEHVLRCLILRADDVTLEMMEKACATRGADSTAPPEEAGGGGRGEGGRGEGWRGDSWRGDGGRGDGGHRRRGNDRGGRAASAAPARPAAGLADAPVER